MSKIWKKIELFYKSISFITKGFNPTDTRRRFNVYKTSIRPRVSAETYRRNILPVVYRNLVKNDQIIKKSEEFDNNLLKIYQILRGLCNNGKV